MGIVAGWEINSRDCPAKIGTVGNYACTHRSLSVCEPNVKPITLKIECYAYTSNMSTCFCTCDKNSMNNSSV